MVDPTLALGDPPNALAGLAGIIGGGDMWAHVNKKEVEAELMRQIANANAQAQSQQSIVGAQQAGSWHPTVAPPPNAPSTGPTLSSRAREMFLKRMGGIRAELKIAAEDYLHCHIYGDKVYLFYCFSGRDGCVKEDIDLFPSDQLITQFRMVLST
jgi:hypothetical protein